MGSTPEREGAKTRLPLPTTLQHLRKRGPTYAPPPFSSEQKSVHLCFEPPAPLLSLRRPCRDPPIHDLVLGLYWCSQVIFFRKLRLRHYRFLADTHLVLAHIHNLRSGLFFINTNFCSLCATPEKRA